MLVRAPLSVHGDYRELKAIHVKHPKRSLNQFPHGSISGYVHHLELQSLMVCPRISVLVLVSSHQYSKLQSMNGLSARHFWLNWEWLTDRRLGKRSSEVDYTKVD